MTAPPVSTDTPPPMVRRSSAPVINGQPAPPPVAAPAPASAPAPAAPRDIEPSHSMNPRALSHYRRAEGFLKTGDRTSAMLQLKMAIAADPKSSFLRAALVELIKA